MRSPDTAFDLRGALTEELRAALQELDAAATRPKAIHQCRVRLKRARALARVGASCAPGLSDVFNDSARGVMRALAGRRELAAFADAARATVDRASKTQARALNSIATVLDAEREALAPLDTERLNGGLRDLLALAQVWPDCSPRQLKRGALRLDRAARRARRLGYGSHEAADRHEWRKREKDRLYAALVLDDAWPRRRWRKKGEKLTALLGQERDADLLIERLLNEPELAGSPKDADRAIKALNRRSRKFSARADEASEELPR